MRPLTAAVAAAGRGKWVLDGAASATARLHRRRRLILLLLPRRRLRRRSFAAAHFHPLRPAPRPPQASPACASARSPTSWTA